MNNRNIWGNSPFGEYFDLQQHNRELEEEIEEYKSHPLMCGYSTKFVREDGYNDVTIHIFCDGTLVGRSIDLSSVPEFIEWYRFKEDLEYEKRVVNKVRESLSSK